MEQFNLEKYLENPSRKVVTRLKKSVQIISIGGKEDIPIVALVEGVAHQYKPNGYHADVVVAYINQCRDMGDYDLFFADEEEEEELTDFEICCMEHFFGNALEPDSEGMRHLKRISQELLELARKELKDEAINNLPKYTYAQGRRDGYGEAFKSLPKWKKFLEEYEELDSHAILLEDNERVVLTGYLEKGDYYIELSELKKLPKEE